MGLDKDDKALSEPLIAPQESLVLSANNKGQSSYNNNNNSSSSTDDEAFEQQQPLLDNAHPHATMGWIGIASMMVATVIGLGILGLSWSLAQLGWVLGLFFLWLSALGAIYSGIWISEIVLFSREHKYAVNVYSDLGSVAYGPTGKRVVNYVQYVFLGGVIVAVQLTAAQSLQQVVHALGGDLCLVNSNLIIMVAMFPLMQLQYLKEVTWMAVLGVVMIIIPMILYFSEISEQEPGPSVGLPESSNFDKFANALTTIIFAFQGQTIFPELLTQMRHPKDFPKAVVVSVVFMTGVYTVFAALGYHLMGALSLYVIDYVDDHDSTGPATTSANAMLIIHVMSGYLINGNVMNHVVYNAIYPPVHAGQSIPRVRWAIATSCTLVASFIISNLIPNLGDLVGVLGATCGCVLTFVFPALFSLKILGARLSNMYRYGHALVLFLVFTFMMIASYATIKKLVDDWKDLKTAPFNC